MGDVYMVNGKILSGLPNHAKDIIFDNTGSPLSSTNTEDAIKEVNSNLTGAWVTVNSAIDYCVRANIMFIKIKDSTAGTLGNIPIEYVPPIQHDFSVNLAGEYLQGYVSTNGGVVIHQSSISTITTIISYPITI